MIALADLKAHLRSLEVKVDPDRDTVLASLEAGAVAFVEGETDRHFGTTITITEYLQGTADDTLWLKEAPSAVTSVEERSEVGGTWTEIDTADSDGWELRSHQVLRKGGNVWERGYEYRVVYDFGYTSGSEPAEIRQLVTDLVSFRWRQRGLEGHASGAMSGYSFTLSDIEAIPGAEQVLERWRWPGVGVG